MKLGSEYVVSPITTGMNRAKLKTPLWTKRGSRSVRQWDNVPQTDSGVLPQTMELMSLGEEFSSQHTPPPPECAAFPEIVQFVKVGEELEQYTPPPEYALFPEIVQFVRVGEERKQNTPPPE